MLKLRAARLYTIAECEEWDVQTDWRFLAKTPRQFNKKIRPRCSQQGEIDERFSRSRSRQ